MGSKENAYRPSYRQRNVDSRLRDHDTRITRLEKAAWIALGYAVADGGRLVTTIAQFV